MTALQKSVPGTPPKATDGDTVRTFQARYNAAVDVLNTQATLTSVAVVLRDLTVADMGKRVNMTPTAAGICHFEAAANCGADQIVSIHNLSSTYDITMAVKTGSGDTPPTIVVVKPGECNTYETDGASAYRTIGRKKPIDETVQGKLSVVGAYSGASAAYTGNVAVGGTFAAAGDSTFSGKLIAKGDASVAGTATFSGPVAANGTVTFAAAPAYSTVAVARGAFTSITAGKAFVVATTGGNSFPSGNSNITWGTLYAAVPSTAFNNVAFTAPVAGWYRFRASVQLASGLDAGYFPELRLLNAAGAILARTVSYSYNTSEAVRIDFEHVVALAAGTYAYFQIYLAKAWTFHADAALSRLLVEQVA